MEILVFLVGIVVVGAFLAMRFRAGGSGAGRVDSEHLEGGPIGYGANVAPPGTSPGASVNAPWFGRDHGGSRGGDAAE